jgi:signal peptidase I
MSKKILFTDEYALLHSRASSFIETLMRSELTVFILADVTNNIKKGFYVDGRKVQIDDPEFEHIKEWLPTIDIEHKKPEYPDVRFGHAIALVYNDQESTIDVVCVDPYDEEYSGKHFVVPFDEVNNTDRIYLGAHLQALFDDKD